MEVTINAETIITAASFFAAIGSLGGVAVWWVRFIDRDKKQDKKLAAIQKEQTLICYGVMACLRGLAEQGCDGPVHEALNKLEKHLNKAAHEEEAA